MVLCGATLGLILSSDCLYSRKCFTDFLYYRTTKSLIIATIIGISTSSLLIILETFVTCIFRNLVKFQWCIYVCMACWFLVVCCILFVGLEQRRDKPNSVDIIFLLGECFGTVTALVYFTDTVISCKCNIKSIIFECAQICFVLVIMVKHIIEKICANYEQSQL